MECACSAKKLQLDWGPALWLQQRMDEETRDRVILACTEAAMMMEYLSVKALGAVAMEPNELRELVRELRRDLAAILDALGGD